ncbi:MAG TPA: diphosphomevalonate decarboxylase [Saprospiraceae bacterium]|nr:diphosphomevalonate decarboxylase [Saprospiraceae bacterium]
MHDTQLTTAWRSPSNIAIIKYWGKHGDQLPDNPSLSITLSKAHTETRITARRLNAGESASIIFLFEGKENPSFGKRVAIYLQRLSEFVPCIKEYHLTIESENSFPHSSGIASSASAMSAIALCVADLQSNIDRKTHDAAFWQQVSSMSRLGSGSACRSVYGPVSVWGYTDMVPGSSDEYAIPMPHVHPVFQTLKDTILIINDTMKAVSSSVGHTLMDGHPFAKARIAQAKQNLKILLPALHSGDLITFGKITEAEAMTLHALMMTSDPAYLLLEPNSLHVLQRIKAFRESTGVPVYFTLDAGPNVHLLYPQEYKDTVREWILGELIIFCKDGRIIEDHAGVGPERI